MAGEDKTLSPEEKLREVVERDPPAAEQGGEADPATAAAAGDGEATTADAGGEGRPKPKLARDARRAEKAEDASADSSDPEQPPPPGKTRRGPAAAGAGATADSGALGGFGVRALNRLLGLAAVVVVLLTGFQLWSVTSAKTVLPPADVSLAAEPGAQADAPEIDLSNVIASYRSQPILWLPGQQQPQSGQEAPPPPPPPSDLKHLEWIGASSAGGETEVIVADRRTGRLHLLTPGQSVSINDDATATFQGIRGGEAMFSVGGQTMPLQRKGASAGQ